MIMLSNQGNDVLQKLWDSFRIKFGASNPGVNMNDIERAFLHQLVFGLEEFNASGMEASEIYQELVPLIEEIR